MHPDESGAAGSEQTPKRSTLTPVEGIDFHVRYHAETTGGDFSDAIRLGSRVAFLLSDIAGTRHETDPIAAETQQAFRTQASELLGPLDANLMDGTALLVQALNLALMGGGRHTRFAPTFVGCYDLQLGILAYINAGGQTAVILDEEGTRPLPNVAMPLGLFTHLTYEPSIQAFEPGTGLLVVTKGVSQSMRSGKEFGVERVMQAVNDSGDASSAAVCKAVLEKAHDFQKPSWTKKLFGKNSTQEDMTALALVRSK